MKKSVSIGVGETARELGVTLKYIYDLIHSGRLTARKEGKIWRIPLDAVQDRLDAKRRVQVSPHV